MKRNVFTLNAIYSWMGKTGERFLAFVLFFFQHCSGDCREGILSLSANSRSKANLINIVKGGYDVDWHVAILLGFYLYILLVCM